VVDEIRKRARRIFVLAGPLPIRVFIRIKKGILVRFANNGVHQNGFQDLFTYTVHLLKKGSAVYLESNDFSDDGIQKVLGQLKAQVPNPRSCAATPEKPFRKIHSKTNYPKVKEDFPLDLEQAPAHAVHAIAEGLRMILAEQASANGYYSAYKRFFYLADTKGLEVFHPATAVRFGVTITKGDGKGYFSFYHPNPRKLKVPPVVQKALELVREASRQVVSVPAGEYECIFSPWAFRELIEPLRRHFDLQFYRDRKSVFSGLLEKPIFSKTFSLHEDIQHPGQCGVPFDAEGAPKGKVRLVQHGVLRELLREGHSTRGLMEHPFYPQNLVVKEGTLSLPHTFEQIKKGIFINKIWYPTLVRESEMEVTGLATGGSLYIENGRIRGRVAHLRYHDSIFAILRSVMGTTQEQILMKDGEMGAALMPYVWVSRLKVV
jgi:predicted Zn-dependent protease